MTELNRSHIIPGYQAAHPLHLPLALMTIIRATTGPGAAATVMAFLIFCHLSLAVVNNTENTYVLS
jgi:hypothetical protein